MRAFADLTERGLLASAISSEEGDGRVCADFRPGSARMFGGMAAEENERRRLVARFAERSGPLLPAGRHRHSCRQRIGRVGRCSP